MNTTIDNDMRVTKRDGNLEEMSFDKILNRIKKNLNQFNTVELST
jgi:hypothetical protein